MASHFERMWEFEAWANRRTLESIGQLAEQAECLRLFGHILAAQRAWLTRLEGGDSSGVELFPTPTVAQCEAELADLETRGAAYLSQVDEGALDLEIDYSNQAGKSFRNPPRDILTHLGLHSQHHRGQIALLVRQAGATPAVTDFIAFCREGR